MAFRIQPNAARDAFDGMIAGAPTNATLAELDAVIDWDPLRRLFAVAYDATGRGQLGFDPVVLYKMLLLEELYALSDVQVSVEAGDRLSFRRFLGLGAAEGAPDDTTLVKFRARLRGHGLIDKARREVERQLAAKNLSVRPGSIKVVDATVIPAATRPPANDAPGGGSAEPVPAQDAAASQAAEFAPQQAKKERRLDGEAAFGGREGKLKYGYKMHAAIDAETGHIAEFIVTPANISDTTVFEELLREDERGVLADKGYDSARNREALRRRGAVDGIMRRVGATREKTLLGRLEKERNRALSKLRSPSEGAFATLKRWRRAGRAIYLGLAKMTEQVTLAVTVHNALKSLRLRERCAQ